MPLRDRVSARTMTMNDNATYPPQPEGRQYRYVTCNIKGSSRNDARYSGSRATDWTLGKPKTCLVYTSRRPVTEVGRSKTSPKNWSSPRTLTVNALYSRMTRLRSRDKG